jgi:two-component system nitrate/nitrite response regulator NarL
LRAVHRARDLQPDVLLLDVSRVDRDGLGAARRVVREAPTARVIGLSMDEESDQAQAMMEAGAIAYLSKNLRMQVLVEAVLQAARGR